MADVQEKIEALIQQAKHGGRAGGISKTRAVFNQLPRIEEALSLGVTRQAIAETFGWTLGEFEGAYRRALAQHARARASGDGDENTESGKPKPAVAVTPAKTTNKFGETF